MSSTIPLPGMRRSNIPLPERNHEHPIFAPLFFISALVHSRCRGVLLETLAYQSNDPFVARNLARHNAFSSLMRGLSSLAEGFRLVLTTPREALINLRPTRVSNF